MPISQVLEAETKEMLKNSERDLTRDKSTNRSFGNTFRGAKPHVGYSRDHKPRGIGNSTHKRKYTFASGDSNSKDITSDVINAMVFHTGMQSTKNVKVTANNPLSPRVTDTLNKFISPNKQPQLKKNSKVMKRYFEEPKGYRSSRNLELTKRTKNATQLIAISSSSRNAASNAVLSNLSATSRLKKSAKHSLTSKWLDVVMYPLVYLMPACPLSLYISSLLKIYHPLIVNT